MPIFKKEFKKIYDSRDVIEVSYHGITKYFVKYWITYEISVYFFNHLLDSWKENTETDSIVFKDKNSAESYMKNTYRPDESVEPYIQKTLYEQYFEPCAHQYFYPIKDEKVKDYGHFVVNAIDMSVYFNFFDTKKYGYSLNLHTSLTSYFFNNIDTYINQIETHISQAQMTFNTVSTYDFLNS